MSDQQEPTNAEPGPRAVSRRAVLGAGAAIAGTAAIPITGAAAASRPSWPVRPQGTTLARTLLHGPPGTLGYRRAVVGPGEPSLVRDDLLGGAARGPGRRRPLLAIGQLTDMHIVDAQSPARVEFLDRLRRPGPAARRGCCRSRRPTAPRRC